MMCVALGIKTGKKEGEKDLLRRKRKRREEGTMLKGTRSRLKEWNSKTPGWDGKLGVWEVFVRHQPRLIQYRCYYGNNSLLFTSAATSLLFG